MLIWEQDLGRIAGLSDQEALSMHRTLVACKGNVSLFLATLCETPNGLGDPHMLDTREAEALLRKDRHAMERFGVWYWLPPHCPRFSGLKGYAPRLLFLRGKLPLGRPAVAIVGTRKADVYGLDIARRTASALASSGVAVVSGGALGVDSAAHEAALDAGGKTLCVLGSGHAKPFPARNRKLFERMVRDGSAVLSEYPCTATARASYFPERNRLIAALSDAVLVVQASYKSGALITARWAAKLGIPLFAVPADIWYESNAGCLKLLRQGARPFVSPGDLAPVVGTTRSELDARWQPPGKRPAGMPAGWKPREPFWPAPREGAVRDHDTTKVVQALKAGPCLVDELTDRSGLRAETLMRVLMRLELEGAVTRTPGGEYMWIGK